MLARISRTAARRARGASDVFAALLRRRLPAPAAGSLRGGRFFFDHEELPRLLQRFRAAYPDLDRCIIEEADHVCEHQFNCLGAGLSARGRPLPWRADPRTGRAWQALPSAMLAVQLNDGQSDIKRVFELSRCQHFAALGQAYAFTGDEKYAQEWAAQMRDWSAENPPLIGPNWIVPMEAAIRIVNWIWGYAFMSRARAFDGEARRLFARSLAAHGDFLLRRPEPYGNHRFSGFVGLIWLGAMFPGFAGSRRWLEEGLRGFVEETRRQTRADGCHFEGSVPYHRLVLEMAAGAWLLLRRNKIELPAETCEAITRMFAFTAGYISSAGPAPTVGDDDDGRLQRLTPCPRRDHRYLLSLGAALTGESRFKTAGPPHQEAFWLLAEQGGAEYEKLPPGAEAPPLAAFADSGFYSLRSRSGGERLFVSARRPHPLDRGAHSHNDHLSFTFIAGGWEFLVDPGTYAYTADLAARDWFRSTRAHNTIAIDGQEINLLPAGDPFRLRDLAECRVSEYGVKNDVAIVAASHRGYARLGVTVERAFALRCDSGILTLDDAVRGNGVHRVIWRFHLAPEVEVERMRSDSVELRRGEARLTLQHDADLTREARRYWYSPRYGARCPASALRFERRGELPARARFIFRPGA